MRPQLIRLLKEPQYSFTVSKDPAPYINSWWHYHPEVELIHFKAGSGKQFIGDSIRAFKDGDVVLVGSNLPHYWRLDDAYFNEGASLEIDVRVAHFCENFGEASFWNCLKTPTLKICSTSRNVDYK